MRFSTITRTIIGLAVVLAIFIVVRDQARRHPERMPWTPLSLAQPIGMFTGRKLVALTQDGPACTALLANAGVEFKPLPPLIVGAFCGYSDGVQVNPAPITPAGMSPAGMSPAAMSPAGMSPAKTTPASPGDTPSTPATAAKWHPVTPKIACPVAAALYLWERDIVGPAARRWFGKSVIGIDHLGSYNCRAIAGSGTLSQHSTADAIDVAGFRLEGGERVTVLADWNSTPEKSAFLHEIRDGACTVFATTLSPDYNAAHADHLHLDQARRGMMAGSVCR